MTELTPPDPPLSRGRVLIRPPGNGDVAAITAACQDPDIIRFTRIPSPYSEQDGRAFIEDSRQGWKEGRSAQFVGIDLHSGALLGSIGLRLGRTTASGEVGYWVAPEARRAGVATTMTWLVTRFGFDDLGLRRITLQAAVGNDASNRIAQRLGFTHEGTLRSAWVDGATGDDKAPRVDVSLYGLLPGELHDPEDDDD